MHLRRVLSAIVATSTGLVAARAHGDDYRPPEYGWSYGEIEQPRTLAMGGAARAWGWSTSSINANPANLVAQHVYHFEALFGLDVKSHRLQFGGAVMDSITSKLALGVEGARTAVGNDSDPYRRGALDVKAAIAYPLSDKVSFGLTGRYLRITQDGIGPLGQSSVSRSNADDPNYRTFTFDAGLAAQLSEAIRIGFVGYNLTSTSTSLAPLMVGGGVGVKVGDATIEANVVGVDKTTWGSWKTRAQIGGEILVGDHYPLRIGYGFDAGSQRHAVSAGTGYVDRSFALDVGVRQEIAGPNDPWGKAFVLGFGIRYFYDVGGAGAGVSTEQPTF